MGAGLVPLQVKKHGTDHDRDEEHHGAVHYPRGSRHAVLCAIFPAAAE